MFHRPTHPHLLTVAFFIGIATALINLFLYATHPPIDTDSTAVLGIIDPEEDEKAYWQSVVTQSPTYRDAWIQLSQLYKNDDTGFSEGALESAYALDPRVVRR